MFAIISAWMLKFARHMQQPSVRIMVRRPSISKIALFKDRKFYDLVLRIRECTYAEQGYEMQDKLVDWLREKGEGDAASWFQRYWTGERKGRWMLANGGIGMIANNMG